MGVWIGPRKATMAILDNDATRRTLLRIGGLAGAAMFAIACAPGSSAPATNVPPPGSAAAPAAPPKAAWEQEWDRLVEAAKKEGRLDLAWVRSTSGGYKGIIDQFQKTFGIPTELAIPNSGSLLVPKVLQEHNAGIYSYDLIFTSVRQAQGLLDGKALSPLKPDIFRPDVVDEAIWDDGYNFGWVDPERQYAYGFGMFVPKSWWMNTDLVSASEFKSAQELLLPKWKGKILLSDYRSGTTATPATILRLNLGEDFLRKLMVEQQPLFMRDSRLLTEAMVKGQYAMGTGVLAEVLEEFKSQGMGRNLKNFEFPESAARNMPAQMFKLKAPAHPNAAKLFANWLLTKEGQAAYATYSTVNSRRKDVTEGDPETKPQPGTKYIWLSGNTANDNETDKTVALLQKLLP